MIAKLELLAQPHRTIRQFLS